MTKTRSVCFNQKGLTSVGTRDPIRPVQKVPDQTGFGSTILCSSLTKSHCIFVCILAIKLLVNIILYVLTKVTKAVSGKKINYNGIETFKWFGVILIYSPCCSVVDAGSLSSNLDVDLSGLASGLRKVPDNGLNFLLMRRQILFLYFNQEQVGILLYYFLGWDLA